MHIAICDDEQYTRLYIRSLVERQGEDCMITELSSGEDLLRYLRAGSNPGIDILFLDIAMGDTDGMETARELRNMQAKSGKTPWGSLPLIIFVTGYSDFMPEAFGVSAFGFIVKPVDEDDFEEIFRRASLTCRALIEKRNRKPKLLTVKHDSVRRVVSVDDVYYIESMGHKVRLHLRGEILEQSAKISDLEEELSPDFFRVHKGYLINLGHVVCYDHEKAGLDNGEMVFISKYKYQDFVRGYMRYISEFGFESQRRDG